MIIDCFCFSVPNLSSTDYSIGENDSNNTIWIKTKEKELMDSVKENDMLVLFDRSTKKFYKDGAEIDVKNKIVFPRSFIPYEEELLSFLEQNGALAIQTKEDLKKIMYWPQSIQPVHRRVVSTTYGEFQQNSQIYGSMFKSIFFKTAKKSHASCILNFFGFIDIKKKHFATKPTLWDVSLEDDVFLSEVFEPIRDEVNDMSCKEYRVFVFNNTLLSISRSYVDYPTDVPHEVVLFVEEQIEKVASLPDFPGSYVLDVGQVLVDGKEVIDIIEFNPISSAGLEVCNLLADAVAKPSKRPRFVRKTIDETHS